MRSVVVTGASRGLGRATALLLARQGWTVLAGMRKPAPLEGCIPIELDVDDVDSVAAAAKETLERVGAPDALVHVAGIAGVGSLEEMPLDAWEQIISTNLLGPIRLTKALLPSMRAAGRGRIVLVSSQGAVRGMPGIGAYSAAKGGLERWGEALAVEVAPFGLGVSVLVTGTFKTDMLELTTTWEDTAGPYAPMHLALRRMGDRILRIARPPEQFAAAVERCLADDASYRRRAVGIDAQLMSLGVRTLPGRAFQRIAVAAMGLPKPGSLRGKR